MGWIHGDEYASGEAELVYRTPEQVIKDTLENQNSLVKLYTDQLDAHSRRIDCYGEKVVLGKDEVYFLAIFRHHDEWAYTGGKLFPVKRDKDTHDFVLDPSRKVSTVRGVVLGD